MELALALVAGLVIGSFLNVCIVRLPLDESVVSPRSRCPGCRKLIAFYDNIPVLSYLLLRGRCRRCGQSFSIRYPIVEALTGVVGVLLVQKFWLTPEWLVYFAFSCALIVLAFVDIDHRILPNPITHNGIWLGIVASTALGAPNAVDTTLLAGLGLNAFEFPHLAGLVASLLGILAGGGVLWLLAAVYGRLRGIEVMGFGDVKLMAMVGALLGPSLAVFTTMIGSVIGAIIGVITIKLAGESWKYELPFGTYLSFGAIAAILYGVSGIVFYSDVIMPAVGGFVQKFL